MVKYSIKPRFLPWFTAGAGVAGFALGLWLRFGGTDFLGLFIDGHPAAILLFLLTAVTLVILAVGVLPLRGYISYKKAFPPSTANLVGSIVAAAGIFTTALVALIRQAELFTVVALIMALLAAVSLVFNGFCRMRGLRSGFLWRCIIIVYFTLHLLVQYRNWSSEPQLLEYFFELMALIFLMLSAYHRAELEVDKVSRRWFVFTNQAALFFCFISLCGSNVLFFLSVGIWVATELCSLRTLRKKAPAIASGEMPLPAPVRYCISTLEAAGHKAYAVGGCVRDALMGLTPHDYDLCTDATPDQIAQLFCEHRLVRSGEKHGTIGVVVDDTVYEITTFRTEGSYSDGRHPDKVEFVSSIKEDLARRDFTVNAMAYNPTEGFVDPFGGREDLQNKILRCVGDPEIRFDEDALRILRGVRFAVRFRMTVDAQTEKAMFTCAELMDRLARERVFEELCKLLPLVNADDLLHYAPVITQVIPELKVCVDFDQHSPHHAFDVYTHIAHVTESVGQSLPLRWAALLHDIGKPATFKADETGRGHFHGHAQVSAEIADAVLLRLKASNELRRQVTFLVEHHMTPLEPDKKLLRRRLTQYGADDCKDLLALQKADFCSKGTGCDPAYFDHVQAMLEETLDEQGCLAVTDLAINGRDLLALGYSAGPKIGSVLASILARVQDETLPNERQALLDAAEAMKEETE